VRACVALKFLPASPPSPLRLPRDKLDHTRKERQEEYIRGRTLQFNSFKKAAAVTMDMQVAMKQLIIIIIIIIIMAIIVIAANRSHNDGRPFPFIIAMYFSNSAIKIDCTYGRCNDSGHVNCEE